MGQSEWHIEKNWEAPHLINRSNKWYTHRRGLNFHPLFFYFFLSLQRLGFFILKVTENLHSFRRPLCRVVILVWSLRASPPVLSMSLWIIKIKCPSLAFFFFCNPTTKTVIWTAYKWELLIANHLDQSLWSTDQKYWTAVRSNLLHSSVKVRLLPWLLPATAICTNLVQKKNQFPEINRHISTFSQ